MTCECGHVDDEHAPSGECTVEGCDCAGFDPEVGMTQADWEDYDADMRFHMLHDEGRI